MREIKRSAIIMGFTVSNEKHWPELQWNISDVNSYDIFYLTAMFKTKAQLMRGKPRVPVEGLFCNYSHRICMQTRLEGFDYCIKHILEDKNSPYKQCNYMSNRTGKRCLNAAPKADKKDGWVKLLKLAIHSFLKYTYVECLFSIILWI